jgi:hypothetical protein
MKSSGKIELSALFWYTGLVNISKQLLKSPSFAEAAILNLSTSVPLSAASPVPTAGPFLH